MHEDPNRASSTAEMARSVRPWAARSSFAPLVVLGPDAAYRAGACAHHDAFGRQAILAAMHALQKGAVGDAGRRKDAVAFRHFLEVVDALEIFDAPAACPCNLRVVAEDETTLHLAADAAQRRCSQNAFRSAAAADVQVDARVRVGDCDDSRDVAVRDELDAATESAELVDVPLMPVPV